MDHDILLVHTRPAAPAFDPDHLTQIILLRLARICATQHEFPQEGAESI
jgi:hypothetical protein